MITIDVRFNEKGKIYKYLLINPNNFKINFPASSFLQNKYLIPYLSSCVFILQEKETDKQPITSIIAISFLNIKPPNDIIIDL